MISHHYGGTSETPQGADELLPVVIMVVFNSGVLKMASQAFYIKKMRNSSLMSSEAEYYLTTYETALDFIIRHKTENLLKEEGNESDLIAQMDEIDHMVSKSGTPTLTPNPSPSQKDFQFKECSLPFK